MSNFTERQSMIAAVAIAALLAGSPAFPDDPRMAQIAHDLRLRHRITEREIAGFFRTADGMRARGLLAAVAMNVSQARDIHARLTKPILEVLRG